MTSREKFEAWMAVAEPSANLQWDPADGDYRFYFVKVHWVAWQASRKQALEEAAAECVRQSRDFYDPRSGPMDGAAACADAIRQIDNPGRPST